MREAHPTERAVGIEYYVSDPDGTGGRLRDRPEDFRVQEIERVAAEPIDADPDAYPYLVVRATLRNWDTTAFASTLSDRLGISRERVDWAGTKDKRAVTTQLFSVDGIAPGDLPAIDGADLEVAGRAGRGIEFGDLAGNAFEVTVAEPTAPERIGPITEALAAFAGENGGDDAEGADVDGVTVGAPNFFGQQRFGSRRPITHEVGLAIVRDRWEEAARTYVADSYPAEPEDTREARQAAADCFEDRDWSGALAALPRRLDYERAILHRLDESAGDPPEAADFRAALEALPSNLQRLFVHAAQSYVFNRILSRRLEAGLPFDRPVEGDAACFVDRDAPDGLALPDVDRTQRVSGSRVEAVARHCRRGRAFVTAPLVGTETELADGEPGEIERAALDEVGIEPPDFDLEGRWESTGTRRAILVRTGLSVDAGADDPSPTFSFRLPKGSYATVLLREYLKVDPVAMG